MVHPFGCHLMFFDTIIYGKILAYIRYYPCGCLIWQLWYTYNKMNYLLAIKDETHIYKAIIEAVPDENDSMMIGLDDFNFPQEEIEEIKNEITII